MAKNTPQILSRWLVLHIPGIYSGNTYYDMSGKGNNGTGSNMGTATRTLQHTNMVFNGSNSEIQCGKVSVTNEVTYSVWMYSNQLSNYANTLGCYTEWSNSSSLAGITILTSPNHQLQLTFAAWSSLYSWGNWPIDKNRWYHVVATLKEWEQKLYVNWALVGSNNKTGLNYSVTSSVNTSLWASIWGSPRRFYRGSLANARVYNRVLSSTEVNLIRNSEYIK